LKTFLQVAHNKADDAPRESNPSRGVQPSDYSVIIAPGREARRWIAQVTKLE
jgi:hypothetical protein